MKRPKILIYCSVFTLLLLFSSMYVYAGTTGKIAGRVVDAENGEPLPGANVIIKGTTMGAAADDDGYFNILNVPPGEYDVQARMMGYQDMTITGVKVNTDFTTRIEFKLNPEVIKTKGVTVKAKREMIQKDLTSSLSIVDEEKINTMPSEEFIDLVNLQAGVIEGHIRGGRSSETIYMLDGISITNPFSNNPMIDVENSVIKELQVISGTFNAEYGQAMSGVVNVVSKEGGKNFRAHFKTYSGDYVSNHTTIFKNIDALEPTGNYNLEGSFSGPLPIMNKKLRLYGSLKRYYNEGYLYGREVFWPTDSCNFSADDPDNWYIESSGDSNYVPMSWSLENSIYGKLTYKHSHENKFDYTIIFNNSDYQEYDHEFKLNPEGDYNYYENGFTHILNWNHLINPETYFELKGSWSFNGNEHYVYADTFARADSAGEEGYVNPDRLEDATNYAFKTGGTKMWHYYQTTTSYGVKFDITSQITNRHKVKMGVSGKKHELYLHEFKLEPKKDAAGSEIQPFQPAIPSIHSTNNNQYTNNPYTITGYIQDKIEYSDFIANVGLRFDYFNPKWKFPTDLRDPNPYYPLRPDTVDYDTNNPTRVDGTPWFADCSTQVQISPRVGISYPITERGVLHGSYGHFFQIPPYQFIYMDSEFEVYAGELETRMGNGNLKAQKTVIYEIGLQQQLTDNIALDVTGFFKNIRNLLGISIHETYLGNRYARYTNRDFGTVKGITLSLEGRYSEWLDAGIDYTFQVAEGTASDPDAVFYDVRANREPQKYIIPLDWDQRHTINTTLTLGYPEDWAITVIGNYGTGFPYTPSYQGVQVAEENSGRKPQQYNVDLRAHWNKELFGTTFSFYTKVYNLTDRKNEETVYASTGRADYYIIENPGTVRGVNSLEEYQRRPHYYSPPRRVILGISVGF